MNDNKSTTIDAADLQHAFDAGRKAATEHTAPRPRRQTGGGGPCIGCAQRGTGGGGNGNLDLTMIVLVVLAAYGVFRLLDRLGAP